MTLVESLQCLMCCSVDVAVSVHVTLDRTDTVRSHPHSFYIYILVI